LAQIETASAARGTSDEPLAAAADE
jgi:hypothetical protein